MNPREFLVFAQTIAKKDSDPAESRRAISGAYYAAFNVVVEFLREKAGLEPHTDKHQGVKTSLLECKNVSAKKLGMQLDSLQEKEKKLITIWPIGTQNSHGQSEQLARYHGKSYPS
jgi:hypothetical protein